MGGSSKKVTVGYKYYLGMHMVLCHGPVDRITRIRVDERDAWVGSRSGGGRININKADLFGGESREGGISGAVDILMGDPNQGVNDYLSARLQNLVPAFRGVVSAVLRQVYVGLNPYLKPWEFRLTRVLLRQDGIPQWYPETAPIRVADAFRVRQRIYLYLDTSGSMQTPVGGGQTRITVAKANILKVLDELKYLIMDAQAPTDIMFSTSSQGSRSYVNVTSANIDSLKTFVANLGTGSTANYRNAFTEAQSWFSAHSGERKNTMVLVVDGEPTPVDTWPTTLEAAQQIINRTGTWSGNNAVDVHVVNIDVQNTFYSEQIDNTAGDGVPVVDGSSSDALYNAVFFAFMGDTIAMNIIHAIRECLTDPVWGMGLPESEIDDASFRAAAKRLRDERMGVCFLWDRQKTIQEVVQELLKHADAALYVDRKTGLFTIKLVRDDFDKEDVLHLTEEHIIKVEDFSRVSFGELATAVTVNFDNAVTGKTSSVRVEDIALASLQQAHIETTLQYPCFPDAVMAGRAAERQLRLLSSQLASCTVHAGRAAADLTVGDPVRITWPEYGLEDVVFRVTAVAYGDGKSNRVKLSLTEDVFGAPVVQQVEPAIPEWEDPAAPPHQIEHFHAIEAPYFELVQLEGQEATDARLSTNPDSTRIAAAALPPPGPNSLNARFYTNAGLGLEDVAAVDYSPGGILANDVDKVSTTLTLASAGLFLEDAVFPLLGQIGEELVWATSAAGNVVTVLRGVLDTVPQEHAAGEALILWDDFLTVDNTEYVTSEQVAVRLQSVNGSGAAPLDEALEKVVDVVGRPYRPYPPGNFLIDGLQYPDELFSTTAELTWAHRDRIQQTAGTPIAQDAASIGPEPGVTYRIRILNASEGLEQDISGIPGTAQVIDLSGMPTEEAVIQLYSERDGLLSYQPHQHRVRYTLATQFLVLPLTYDEEDHMGTMSWSRLGAAPDITPMGFEGNGWNSRLTSTTIPAWMASLAARLTLHATVKFLPDSVMNSTGDTVIHLGENAPGLNPKAKLALRVKPDPNFSRINYLALECFTTANQSLPLCRPEWQFRGRYPQLTNSLGKRALPQGIMFLDADTFIISAHYEDTETIVHRIDVSTGAVTGQFSFGSNHRHVASFAQNSLGETWCVDYETRRILKLDLAASFASGTAVILADWNTSILTGTSGIAFTTVGGTEYVLTAEYATSGTRYLYVIPASQMADGATFAIASRFKRFVIGRTTQGITIKDGDLLVSRNTSIDGQNGGWIETYPDINSLISTLSDGANLSASLAKRENGPSRNMEDLAVHPTTGEVWAPTEGWTQAGDEPTLGWMGVWSSPMDSSVREHHVTAEYNAAGKVTVKLNGLIFGERDWTPSVKVDIASIGAPPQAAAEFENGFFKGYIKNVRFQNKELQPSEYAETVSGSFETNTLTAYPVTIINPGAESDTTGWTNELGTITTRVANPVPYEGAAYFTGGPVPSTIARNRLDLLAASGVTAAELDTGLAWAKLRWHQASYNNSDPATLGLRMLDASLGALDLAYGHLDWVPYGDNGATPNWQQLAMARPIPANTRSMDVVFRNDRTAGTNTDGYVDAISLVIYRK